MSKQRLTDSLAVRQHLNGKGKAGRPCKASLPPLPPAKLHNLDGERKAGRPRKASLPPLPAAKLPAAKLHNLSGHAPAGRTVAGTRLELAAEGGGKPASRWASLVEPDVAEEPVVPPAKPPAATAVRLGWPEVLEPGPCEETVAAEEPEPEADESLADEEYEEALADADDDEEVAADEDFDEEEASLPDVEVDDDEETDDESEPIADLNVVQGFDHERVLINKRIVREFGYPQAAIVGWIAAHQGSDDKKESQEPGWQGRHGVQTSGCLHRGRRWIYDSAADLAGKLGMNRDTFFTNLAKLKERKWVEHIGRTCCKVTNPNGKRFFTRKALYRVNLSEIAQWCKADVINPTHD
jgi:hypothetical protein